MAAQSYSASLYLPLHQQPHIEAKIERLFVAANMAINKRPIPVKQLQLAVQKTKLSEPRLAAELERYLQRYTKDLSFTAVSAQIANTSGVRQPLANGRGQTSDSAYAVSAQGYYAASDNVYVNAGFMSYDKGSDDKQSFAEGSYLSFGPDTFQVDIGFRPHSFGPFSDGQMILSTNASSVPSVTFSNVLPLDFLGLSYEVFYGQMSHSDKILNEDRSGFESGYPKLFAVHLNISPLEGFSLGFNRLMQYGGGNNDESLKGIFGAFFNAAKNDNIGASGRDFGNQLSSLTSSYTFAGEQAVAVYMEYAGEDTSAASKAHLGNTSLMMGVYLPEVSPFFDLRYEYAQWQGWWYINANYGDGLTQNGAILGHWGASRIGVGKLITASIHSLKFVAISDSSHELQGYFRKLDNTSFYASESLTSGYEFSLEYGFHFYGTRLGAQWMTGRDVNNQKYTMLTGLVRW